MANEHLTRTPTSGGNKKVWTWSGWVKFADISAVKPFFGAFFGGSSRYTEFYTNSSNQLEFFGGDYDITNSSTTYNIWNTSVQVVRDCGSWMHVHVAYDTTHVSEQNRLRMYINGKYISNVTRTATPAQNSSTYINSPSGHFVGAWGPLADTANQSFEGEMSDVFLVDGQALEPDVFGFYKDGDGYMSSGDQQATDFLPGQWSPHSPSKIKKDINRSGGFGANGYYMPLNDSSNPGADFHCTPNSIITLKGEDLPQPRNGAPTTSDAYVSELRQEIGELGFAGCVKFDGVDDYLTVPSSDDFAFGTGDFTIEAFCYRLGGFFSIFDHQMGVGNFTIFSYTNDVIQVYNNTFLSSGVDPGNRRWFHLAVVRQSGTLSFYIDGVKASTTHTFNHLFTTAGVNIGMTNYGERSRGLVSNLRVIKGTALYTSDFTPPTGPLTNVTNTKLLCCQSSTSATAAAVIPTGSISGVGGIHATTSELTGSIVLAVAGISTATGANLVTNGHFDANTTGWTAVDATLTWAEGRVQTNRTGGSGYTGYQAITVESGKRYTISSMVDSTGTGDRQDLRVLDDLATNGASILVNAQGTDNEIVQVNGSFTATGSTHYVYFVSDSGGTGAYSDIVVKQEDAPRDYSSNIKGSGSNKTLTPGSTAGVGYELGGYYGSAMNFDGDGDELNITASSDFDFGSGDFTIEAWIYPRVYNSGNMDWIGKNGGSPPSSQAFEYGILSNGQLVFYHSDGSNYSNTGVYGLTLPNGSAPVGQWTHVVGERHGNTFTAYINGTAAGTINNFLSGASMPNTTVDLCIGADSASTGTAWHWDGRIQDLRIYKGEAKYKGGFDVAKPYTAVNFVSDNYRTIADTCKNNFATLNPILGIGRQDQLTYSEGNLRVESAATTGSDTSAAANTAFKGKIYCEFYLPVSAVGAYVGLMKYNTNLTNSGTDTTASSDCWIVRGDNGNKANGGGGSGVSYGSAFSDGDLIMMAVDIDNTSIWWGKNGTWFASGDPAANTNAGYTNLPSTEDLLAICGDNYSSETPHIIANFGQNPAFSGTLTAGTNADDSGKGLFKYAPPSGFLALCEDNLPTPAIADPGDHFKCLLYGGDGTNRSFSGVGFKPDLLWIKSRNTVVAHVISDTVRGVGNLIFPNDSGAESAASNPYVLSVNDDGWSAPSGGGGNVDGRTYVAWCWKAGGAAVTNYDGSITSQVSVNQDAGFSIVSYTGTGANATIGHGLGKTPKLIIVKNRDSVTEWPVLETMVNGGTHYLRLDGSYASTITSVVWNNTNPTSDVFSVGTYSYANENNSGHIAYCWAEIEGFSKFGSYVGNGNADGPFVYCGFKPAWVMVKSTGSSEGWPIFDSSRGATNPNPKGIYSNSSNAENDAAGRYKDFVSNGFKIRGTSGEQNTSGITYIFAAFAESPFQTANAK